MQDNIRNYLKKREEYLKKLIRNKKRSASRAPEGRLRIANTKYGPQYYHRIKETDKTGVYIPVKHKELVKRLAQKDYDERVMTAATKELFSIEKYYSLLPEIISEEVYTHLSAYRKSLVHPISESDEEFLDRWVKEEFVCKAKYGSSEFTTLKGENVRSKSELIIANTLTQYGIPYRYESQLYLEGLGMIHPDFTVLHVRLREERYWEHEGRMDDPEYADTAIKRERAYIRNGFYPGDRLIVSSETMNHPLDTQIVKMLIEKYLL